MEYHSENKIKVNYHTAARLSAHGLVHLHGGKPTEQTMIVYQVLQDILLYMPVHKCIEQNIHWAILLFLLIL